MDTLVERAVQHSTFTIERTFAAPPATVFAAWSSREAKSRWFGGTTGKWKELRRELDFKAGGREVLRGQWTDGPMSNFEARYHEIVPGERIVYAYDMYIDDRRISISLATVQFRPAGTGTKLIVTEQGAFLDGHDDAGSRERGTGALMDKLEGALWRPA